MKGAEIIATKLVAAGCKHAFGIPGGEVLGLLESLHHAGINFTLTKHENAAGFMAEGVWHATSANTVSAPGVLLATIGPGVVNAINVVTNAMQDRVPLIFLTGCIDDAEAETYTHQIFDHQTLLRPIVKASFKASSGAISPMMDKAIAISLEQQPGPVHIDVPISVAEHESIENHTYQLASPTNQQLSVATGELLEDARTILSAAKNPIAIAGLDAVNSNCHDIVTKFCEQFNVPLITTYKGKGLLDERHPLSLGGAGLSLKADDILQPLLDAADLIILIGYDPIEQRIGWRDPWPHSIPVFDLTPVLRTHGMHSVTHTLRGNVALTLSALIKDHKPIQTWTNDSIKTVKNELIENFAAKSEKFSPATIFHTLREFLPENTVVTADSGAHRILVSQIWQCYQPRTMLQSTALCTMACALPLGIGYKLASPETPVVVFVGDAGLEMGLGELATLRDLKLPIIICVLVDESLALIELKQRNSQRANVGVDFQETNFPKVAEAIGGYGVWIEDKVTLIDEISKAIDRETFTILACRVGSRAYDGEF